jgi:hypothetical protein
VFHDNAPLWALVGRQERLGGPLEHLSRTPVGRFNFRGAFIHGLRPGLGVGALRAVCADLFVGRQRQLSSSPTAIESPASGNADGRIAEGACCEAREAIALDAILPRDEFVDHELRKKTSGGSACLQIVESRREGAQVGQQGD